MGIRNVQSYSIPARTTAGVDLSTVAGDFRHIDLILTSIAASDQVVQVVGSDAVSRPDFSASSTATNPWTAYEVVDRDTGSAIAGTAGITVSGASVKSYEANINGARWIGIKVVSGTAGAISGTLTMYDNQ